LNHQFVRKAGAYVITNHVMPFMVGPTPDNTALAVVRLGGHKEGNETAWECAQREVFEESGMRISPLAPSMTFSCPKTTQDSEITLEPIIGYQNSNQEPRPLIIGHHDTVHSLTAMYLAQSDDEPVPSMETKALILLSRNDVFRLCKQTVTLEEFESAGGKVLYKHQLDTKLPLRPFAQLIMLSMILDRYPDVISTRIFP
jgi:ADP-ribose pyrophosphatase YjhB (NUDIX family)